MMRPRRGDAGRDARRRPATDRHLRQVAPRRQLSAAGHRPAVFRKRWSSRAAASASRPTRPAATATSTRPLQHNGKPVKTKGYCQRHLHRRRHGFHRTPTAIGRSSSTSRSTPRTRPWRCRTPSTQPYKKMNLAHGRVPAASAIRCPGKTQPGRHRTDLRHGDEHRRQRRPAARPAGRTRSWPTIRSSSS